MTSSPWNEQRLQQSLSELAGWQLAPLLLNPMHLAADAVQHCVLSDTQPSTLAAQYACAGPGAASSWTSYNSKAACVAAGCATVSAHTCTAVNLGASCRHSAHCSGTRTSCEWRAGVSPDYSIVQVMQQLLALGARVPALLPVAQWAAFGIRSGRPPLFMCRLAFESLYFTP